MIVDHALNEAEQRKAQRVYQLLSALNAGGANFCSEAILVLLALSIHISDVWVSGIGSLTYVSYLVLPLGFFLSSKLGVCGSYKVMKTAEGLMCLLVMLSAVFMHGILQSLLFFLGVILLYTSRSGSCAMLFPLQKNICTEKTLTAMLSRNQITAMVTGTATILLTAWLLKVRPDSLPFLLIGGFVLLSLTGFFATSIPEPDFLKRMAAQPLLKQVILAMRNALLRKQLVTGCILNLIQAMILPINILAAKIGFGLTDSAVLCLSVIQIFVQIAASYFYKLAAKKIGPRNVMVLTYPLTWILALYWILIPDRSSFLLAVFPFAVGGMAITFYSTALANYFMISIPNRLQVGGTFLVFVVTGGMIGALGVCLNPLILSGIKTFCVTDGIAPYKVYFLITGLISLPGIISPLKLPVKYKEYRAKHTDIKKININ